MFGATLLVALGAWWWQRPRDVAPSLLATGVAQGDPSVAGHRPQRVSLRELDRTIDALERTLQGQSPNTWAEHLSHVRGLGPRASNHSQAALARSLDESSDVSQRAVAMSALLEAGSSADDVGGAQALARILEHEPSGAALPWAIELQALMLRRLPDPQRAARLRSDFSRALSDLEHALRQPDATLDDAAKLDGAMLDGPARLDERSTRWELARALFRAAPSLHDPELDVAVRRSFAKLTAHPRSARPGTLAPRLEAVATFAVASSGDSQSERDIITSETSALLDALAARSPAAHTAHELCAYIRALRLARRALTSVP